MPKPLLSNRYYELATRPAPAVRVFRMTFESRYSLPLSDYAHLAHDIRVTGTQGLRSGPRAPGGRLLHAQRSERLGETDERSEASGGSDRAPREKSTTPTVSLVASLGATVQVATV